MFGHTDSYISTFDLSVEAAEIQIKKFPSFATMIAAGNGHIDILKRLCDEGCSIGKDTMIAAICGGQLPILGWLYDVKGLRPIPKNSWLLTIKWCRFDIATWLQCHKFSMNYTLPAYALTEGHYAMFEWLLVNRCPVDKLTGLIAAQLRYPDALQRLIALGVEIDKDKCMQAVKGEIFIYLKLADPHRSLDIDRYEQGSVDWEIFSATHKKLITRNQHLTNKVVELLEEL